jgi:hypothetical protein
MNQSEVLRRVVSIPLDSPWRASRPFCHRSDRRLKSAIHKKRSIWLNPMGGDLFKVSIELPSTTGKCCRRAAGEKKREVETR